MKTILGLGSNMGDRRHYLEEAVCLIGERAGTVTAESGLYETKAYGYTDQDDFLNMAVTVETELSPRELLEVLHGIEAELGRVRLIRWGPRTIDLDILYYGDLVLDEEDLSIPHIDLHNRAFVLEPVCEIEPDYYDMRRQKTVRELLEELKIKEDRGIEL